MSWAKGRALQKADPHMCTLMFVHYSRPPNLVKTTMELPPDINNINNNNITKQKKGGRVGGNK